MASSESISSTSPYGWASLPWDLLDLIVDKLIVLPDFIRFAAVCKWWFSLALDRQQQRLRACLNQPPMLLIPTRDRSPEIRSLYSLTEGKTYDCRFQVPCGKRFSGSCYGWLAMAEDNLTITLTNPFSGKTIQLPPVAEVPSYLPLNPEEYPDYQNPFPDDDDDDYIFRADMYVPKVILSQDPSLDPDGYEVVVIFGGCSQLAFIRSGEQSWITFESTPCFYDVIYYKGQFCAVNCHNELVTIYSNGVMETIVPRSMEPSLKSYLVPSSKGDLLLVRRCYTEPEEDDLPDWLTTGFRVYKLMMHSNPPQECEWVEIESLGDDALFLGDNIPMSVQASHFPNCLSNSIYYTADCIEMPGLRRGVFNSSDMGVFNMDDGTLTSHYELDSSLHHMPPAIWIMPRSH